jgi:class 3 adenylate cyclase
VHYAARVANHALAGEVLVSSLVRELIAAGTSDFTFLERREAELKGLDGTHQLHSVALT